MLPETLRKRRERLYLTQAELAAKLGVTVTTVSRWETGSRSIPLIAERLLGYIEDEPLAPEEEARRYQRMQCEAEEREANLTPEERERAERWFGNKRKEQPQSTTVG
jgi:transcriptional regulator with XRE-family HTH domain